MKIKNGDISDVNNYRAIALANVETRILETVILDMIQTDHKFDSYQFALKKGIPLACIHLQSNRPLSITQVTVAMFLLVLLTSLKLLIELTTGNFSTSYYQMGLI